MSEQAEQELTNAVHSPDLPVDRHSVFLDKAFPPTWLLGVALVIVLVLSLISGWKIFNLEYEREGIEEAKALLGKDRQTFAKLTQELPELQQKHQNLTAAIAALQGQLVALKSEAETIQAKAVDGRKSFEVALAERDKAEAAAQAARDENGRLNASITTATSKLDDLQRQVSTLSAQEQDLRQSTAALQKQSATLTADVQGLAQRRDDQMKMLQQMTAERAKLDSLSERIGVIATKFEASGEMAGQMLKSLNQKDVAFGKAVAEVTSQASALSRQTQALSSQSGALHTATQGLETINRDARQAADALVQNGGASADAAAKLQNATTSIGTQAHSLAQAAQGPVDAFSAIVGKLDNSLQALGKDIQGLHDQTEALQGRIGDIGQSAKMLDSQTATVHDTTSQEIDAIHNLATQAQQRLGTEGQGMIKMLTEMQGRLEALDRHLQSLDQAVQSATDAHVIKH